MTSVTILSIVVAIAAPLPKERPKSTSSIVGDWVVVKYAGDGKEWDEDQDNPLRFVFFDNGTYDLLQGPRTLHVGVKFVIDLKSSPATIDLDTDAVGGWVYRGIFKVERDVLTVCLANFDNPRPTAFESKKGTHTTLHVLKRVKKE
jgi:uncharacterized protein (TIGR03067 family)